MTRGRTLGIVGESGSGKSVLSRSIMGLLPSNAERTGTVSFEGEDLSDWTDAEYRSLWGTEMAMIFQDPMTALNPVMKVGHQITESLRFHLDMDRSTARDTAVEILRSVRIPEPAKRFSSYPPRDVRGNAAASGDSRGSRVRTEVALRRRADHRPRRDRAGAGARPARRTAA
ncbi:MAG: ATP-binding cassette domain-containing protein [Microthrixaceae bacterium]|nr:ATP-binding cassette domain-containing protein [Microthrixaceae bacterium]